MDSKFSMTAMVSCFSRAYHSINNDVKVFDDDLAFHLIKNEYDNIGHHMTKGIQFFNPSFVGNEKEALDWIVNHQLSPTPLGRAAYAEEMLINAINIGARQYLILGAGFDTLIFRQSDILRQIKIIELDHPKTQHYKLEKIKENGWELPSNVSLIPVDFTEDQWEQELIINNKLDTTQITFCSLLGVTYYLSKESFKFLLIKLYNLLPEGSSIVFDYPDEYTFTEKASARVNKQLAMANMSGEKMVASYSYLELESILSDCGYLIYDHINPEDINIRYFKTYNDANPKKKLHAFENIKFCLAVKKM